MVKCNYIFVLLCFSFFACTDIQEKDSIPKKADGELKRYLLTGHTYSWDRQYKVDRFIEEIPKNFFDGFWHGGDMISETTMDSKFADYLNEIFDLKNPMTHVAYGNHDARNGNKRFFNAYRNRSNSYYSHTQDGLCFLILDSTLNPNDCRSLEEQFELIKNTCDTIKASSHLLLLIHDSVWDGISGLPDPKSYANGNQKYWNPSCSSSETTFASSIYPLLLEVKERGIEVVCMMGDTGWKKGGAFESSDGIHFIASGINNSYYLKDPDNYSKQNPDIVYLFTHHKKDRTLKWEAVELPKLNAYINQL